MILRCHFQQQKLSYGNWKLEVINDEPRMVIFHDIISESEITTLKVISSKQVQLQSSSLIYLQVFLLNHLRAIQYRVCIYLKQIPLIFISDFQFSNNNR